MGVFNSHVIVFENVANKRKIWIKVKVLRKRYPQNIPTTYVMWLVSKRAKPMQRQREICYVPISIVGFSLRKLVGTPASSNGLWTMLA